MAAGPLLFKGENFLERFFIDFRFSLSSALAGPGAATSPIVIVCMDGKSADALGIPIGPKFRRHHPSLVRTLDAVGASLIVFDAYFIDEEKEWDAGLAESFKAAGNVIVGEGGPPGTVDALLQAPLAFADLNWVPIGRNAVPRFVPVETAAGALQPLSIVAAREYSRRRGEIGSETLSPHDPGFWVNFRVPPSAFTVFSYIDVLRAEDGRIRDAAHTPLSIFKDAIAFIGTDNPWSPDRFALPNTFGKKYPGVFGQAYATDTLLEDRRIDRASPWMDAAVSLFIIALLIAALELRSRGMKALLIALLAVVPLCVDVALFQAGNIWLGYAPIIVSVCTVLIAHWVILRVSMAAGLRLAFGFDPRLIEAFRVESAGSGGKVIKDVTVLIADARDYTDFIARTEPSVASKIMGEFFDAMEHCVSQNGGYINKYVGDQIVAVFGFPLENARCVERAVRAGMSMLRELSGLASDWHDRFGTGIRKIGIGIDAGPASFVEVGGKTKSQFDILGDCINGASRIQGLTKKLKRDLLISEEVYRGIETDDALAGSFVFLKEETVRGQGKRRIYALM
jgi:adenylate cyclase